MLLHKKSQRQSQSGTHRDHANRTASDGSAGHTGHSAGHTGRNSPFERFAEHRQRTHMHSNDSMSLTAGVKLDQTVSPGRILPGTDAQTNAESVTALDMATMRNTLNGFQALAQ